MQWATASRIVVRKRAPRYRARARAFALVFCFPTLLSADRLFCWVSQQKLTSGVLLRVRGFWCAEMLARVTLERFLMLDLENLFMAAVPRAFFRMLFSDHFCVFNVFRNGVRDANASNLDA